MTLAEFLANIKRINKRASRNRIETADKYLSTLGKCSGNLCPTDRARYEGEAFAKRLKEAAQSVVYKNDLMNFVSWNKSGVKSEENGTTLNFLAGFRGVYTSTKEDRDSDILEASGGEVDPKMPLLWQHDSTAPIGRHLNTISQDKQTIIGECGIAPTALGTDAALLAELGCLRLSQGFRPKEFEPITQKNGREEVITGFHVTKYEMMEISLVSVPSNTDAVLEQFHRNKLAASLSKSWAKSLNDVRKRTFTTGWGSKALRLPEGRTVVGIKRAAPTGIKRIPRPRKDTTDIETALAEACGGIVHSGDYGLCFYRPGQDAATVEVWWTSGDADDPASANEAGQNYTSGDDIKSMLGAVPGVTTVTVESESNPPYDEGWREVYPEVRDWTSGDADKPQATTPPADTPPPPADDSGKGAKGKKDGAPVAGSAEAISNALAPLVTPYLTQNGVAVDDGAEAVIQATFPDSVIVRVGGDADGTGATYYRLGFSAGSDGTAPTLNGTPEQVELQTVVADAPPGVDTPPAPDAGTPPPADPNNPPPGAAGHKPPGKKRSMIAYVLFGVKPQKGKLGKKDSSCLKEAVEHLDDAMKRDGMPTVCKTLVKRGADLVQDVIKSDGSQQPDQQGQGGDNAPAPVMAPDERSLWDLIVKMAKNPKASKTAIAALLSELASKLEGSDITAMLASLGSK